MNKIMASSSADFSPKNYIVHPYKSNLWLFIITVVMIFGGLTSAYLVARASIPVQSKVYFELPAILWLNLAIILISSVTMRYAVMQSYANNTRNSSLALLVTFVLGLLFLGGQLGAFANMIDRGYYLVNPAQKDQSVAFFYVFVGLHAVHVVGAVLVLLYTIIKTSGRAFKPGNRVMTFEVAATFWHFLGLLWVYLFVFLLLTQR